MIPKGWYFCAESSEIKSRQIVEKKIFDQQVILWRTESGVLNMSTAVCPHLGSNLAKLGKVRGENLQCFSHDYTYNGEGDCVATGQKVLPTCHKKVLRYFPLQELNGFVIAWYDPELKEPDWSIPIEVFSVMSKNYVRSTFEFNVSIETINEDNFDVGHLYKWHHVYDVKTTPVEQKGPMISISHAFKRHSILFKKSLPYPFSLLSQEINSRYSSTLHGHGLTNSFIDIFNLQIRLHDLIWCTPITATRTLYTTFVRLLEPSEKLSMWRRLMRRLIFVGCVWRLRQEHKHEGHGFWEQQTRIDNPILTEAERKLIIPYRTWCGQFV
ncbi:MAG: Rieske 2Fe-2S domain-containing protein [Gammaproteobacteria bacterium]|nr:Rieske 2Fe-2S domain-containing protein [Gammaproteobacteria bacterium]